MKKLVQIDQNNPVTRGSTALVYKKETLEEAKERYLDSPLPHSYRLAVEFGAKWQEEETIEEVFDWLTTHGYLTDLKETMMADFKRFKQKQYEASKNS